jgi:hypothetical protein
MNRSHPVHVRLDETHRLALGMHPFFALTAPLGLFPFRYRDPLTGKWVRARYVAELHEIAERKEASW